MYINILVLKNNLPTTFVIWTIPPLVATSQMPNGDDFNIYIKSSLLLSDDLWYSQDKPSIMSLSFLCYG